MDPGYLWDSPLIRAPGPSLEVTGGIRPLAPPPLSRTETSSVGCSEPKRVRCTPWKWMAHGTGDLACGLRVETTSSPS